MNAAANPPSRCARVSAVDAVGVPFGLAGLLFVAQRVEHRRFVRPGGRVMWVERNGAVAGGERLVVAAQRGENAALVAPGGDECRIEREEWSQAISASLWRPRRARVLALRFQVGAEFGMKVSARSLA